MTWPEAFASSVFTLAVFGAVALLLWLMFRGLDE